MSKSCMSCCKYILSPFFTWKVSKNRIFNYMLFVLKEDFNKDLIRTYVGRSNQICCGLRLEFLARQVLGTWNAVNIIFFKMLSSTSNNADEIQAYARRYAIFTLYTITHFSILNNISRHFMYGKRCLSP